MTDSLDRLIRNAFAAFEYGENATARRLANEARTLVGTYIGQGRISVAEGKDILLDIEHIK